MYMADLLDDTLGVEIQSVVIYTTNPSNPDTVKATQKLPLQNVFMNYLVDLDLLSRGKPFSRTIIAYNYWSQV